MFLIKHFFLSGAFILFTGNSLTIGYPYAYPGGNDWPTQMLASAPFSTMDIGFRNAGITGQSIRQMQDSGISYDAQIVPGKMNVLVFEEGTNSILNELESAGDAVNRVRSYCTMRRAAGWNRIVIIGCMKIDSTNARAPIVKAFNDSLRIIWPQIADGFVDISTCPELQNPYDLTYRQNDALHLKAEGYRVKAVKAAPVFLNLH